MSWYRSLDRKVTVEIRWGGGCWGIGSIDPAQKTSRTSLNKPLCILYIIFDVQICRQAWTNNENKVLS